MTFPVVKYTQADSTANGRRYENAVIAHLQSLGATAAKSSNHRYDIDATWPDGRIERIECKGGGRGYGLDSARAKEVFAMSALCGPLVVYTNKLPAPGKQADQLMKLAESLGWITAVRLFVENS